MITIEHLTKRYGATTAVEDVSFEVLPGSVTGFLGPNGAGKSTTLRMLTGLTIPTSGHSSILGVLYRDLANPAARVGCLLDASAQHPGRSGRETLNLARIVMGLPAARIDQVLKLVGLTGREAKARVGTYSLGMRQRLGVAQALLGAPEVLVLDEPANGLDPQGIHWMRTLLRRFADSGGTVLLSSHLLHEVKQVADRIVMIGQGRIVADGRTEELLAGGSDLEQIFLQMTASTARGGLADADVSATLLTRAGAPWGGASDELHDPTSQNGSAA